MTYQESIYEMIDTVAKRVAVEVPDSGAFAPVSEFFKNTNPQLAIDKYMLKVLEMSELVEQDKKKRYIEASVYNSTGDYKADMLLLSGSKKTIIKELGSEQFPGKLNNAFIQLVDILLNP